MLMYRGKKSDAHSKSSSSSHTDTIHIHIYLSIAIYLYMVICEMSILDACLSPHAARRWSQSQNIQTKC